MASGGNTKQQEEEHNFMADDVNWRQVVETENGAVINWHENWAEFFETPSVDERIEQLQEKAKEKPKFEEFRRSSDAYGSGDTIKEVKVPGPRKLPPDYEM